MKDPTGFIDGAVHGAVLDEAGATFCVGAVLIVHNVTIFRPSTGSAFFLNIVPDNFFRLFPVDDGGGEPGLNAAPEPARTAEVRAASPEAHAVEAAGLVASPLPENVDQERKTTSGTRRSSLPDTDTGGNLFESERHDAAAADAAPADVFAAVEVADIGDMDEPW